MFTLNFPIRLPEEHTFIDDGMYPVPLLPGGLSCGCYSSDNGPLIFGVSGFATEQDAIDFCPTLRAALQVVALDSEHSITPSGGMPTVSHEAIFNGSVPTVTPTENKASPYYLNASMRNGLHVSVLSKRLAAALVDGAPGRASAVPKLALSLQLYSDCQFAGERNAQFIVLMTSLEILVPNMSGSKRGPVVALVKNALTGVGHPNPKSVGKALDALYKTRNSLLHEAQSVKEEELQSLKNIVRSTLKALIA